MVHYKGDGVNIRMNETMLSSVNVNLMSVLNFLCVGGGIFYPVWGNYPIQMVPFCEDDMLPFPLIRRVWSCAALRCACTVAGGKHRRRTCWRILYFESV